MKNMKDTGLSTQQVNQRKEAGLVNGTQKKITRSFHEIICANLFTYFNFINAVLFAFVCFTGRYRNGLFMGTVIFNAFVGIRQELKSKRLLDQMRIMAETKVHVLRDGKWESISTSEIVQDDILQLKAGMQIPVDGRMIEGNLEVNESMLSGESDIVEKHVHDKVYAGTIVTADHAVIQVAQVGMQCVASRINADAQKEARAKSVLHTDLEKMIQWISYIIIPTGAALFFVQYEWIHLSRNEAILKTVAAVVGMIPEGLVVLASIALAISTIRLSRRSVLVQDLFSIESLARIDMVCFDKTGTLTTGNMKVLEVIPCGITDQMLHNILSSYLYQMKDINATALALSDYFHEEEIFKKIEGYPFSSERKYAIAQLDTVGSIYLGAYESLFPSFQKDPRIEVLASKGKRVVIAARSDHFMKEGLPKDLEMIGIIALEDECRENADEIMQYFQKQNVSIKIISGDDAKTVSSLAKHMNIPNAFDVVDMSQEHEDYDSLVQKYSVFGRVKPEEKKYLIQALKEQGHHVLMCGDGVNDVSAMKNADVSITMNAGSDACKNASNIILLNDDFSSISFIIQEGRRVINNISRASSMYLIKTIFSILLSLYVILFHESYPFLPIQLTLISAIGVGIPTLVLQMEPCFERIHGDFLKQAFLKALPSSVAISFTVIVCLWMQDILGYTDSRMNGIFVFLTSYIYLFTLLRIYFPLTKLRVGIVTLMCLILFCLLGFFGHMISVSFEITDVWIFVGGMILEPLIIYVLVKCLTKIESMVRKNGITRKN